MIIDRVKNFCKEVSQMITSSQAIDILRDYIDSVHDGNTSAAATALGENPQTIWQWYSGARKNPKMDKILPVLEKIGVAVVNNGNATIRRPAPNAPSEDVSNTDEDLTLIPVMGQTGAGNAVEFFSAVPESYAKIPKKFAVPGMVALEVAGDSMEPTIRKGALVGICPLGGDLVEGNIYLIDQPPFGRVIKRLYLSSSGKLEAHSDNKLYAPFILPNEGYENMILGRVVFVMQTF